MTILVWFGHSGVFHLRSRNYELPNFGLLRQSSRIWWRHEVYVGYPIERFALNYKKGSINCTHSHKKLIIYIPDITSYALHCWHFSLSCRPRLWNFFIGPGDFAIYLKNGATKWQAIGLNVSAAVCAFIGLYIGIAVGQDAAAREWILALVAGMFLYIALVQVVSITIGREAYILMIDCNVTSRIDIFRW